jgi:sugar O-acyltransferase (sialic acid O-acetyltransferase NeuD family)
MNENGLINIYVLGDNLFALSMIFETIAKNYGKDSMINIVINRKFNLTDEEFNRGLCKWKLVDQTKFLPNADDKVYLAGMSGQSRSFLFDLYLDKLKEENFEPLVHPSSELSTNVEIGIGSRIEQAVIIGPMTKLGKACLLNRGSIIGHHTVLGDFVNINPGAIINGTCSIGNYTTIGSGAIVNDGITIGKNSVVGSGALVTKNIPDGVVVYGSPAKIIRENR